MKSLLAGLAVESHAQGEPAGAPTTTEETQEWSTFEDEESATTSTTTVVKDDEDDDIFGFGSGAASAATKPLLMSSGDTSQPRVLDDIFDWSPAVAEPSAELGMNSSSGVQVEQVEKVGVEEEDGEWDAFQEAEDDPAQALMQVVPGMENELQVEDAGEDVAPMDFSDEETEEQGVPESLASVQAPVRVAVPPRTSGGPSKFNASALRQQMAGIKETLEQPPVSDKFCFLPVFPVCG